MFLITKPHPDGCWPDTNHVAVAICREVEAAMAMMALEPLGEEQLLAPQLGVG